MQNTEEREMYKAQIVLDIDFPKAGSVKEAQETLDTWLDIISEVMCDKVNWPEVWGDAVSEVKE